MDAPRERRSQWLLPPLLLGAIGILLAHHPLLASGFSAMQGNRGDPRLDGYLLEHGWRWLTGDPLHARLWDPPFFFPTKNVLAYSDVMLLFGPLYWPWRALGAAPDTAFQLWEIAASALSFAAAHALFRCGLRFAPWPAAIGALLVACGAPRVNQIDHPQLLPSFYTSLAILAAARVFEESASSRSRRAWIALGFAAEVAQLWSAFYPAWFLALGAMVSIVIALASAPLRARFVHVIACEWAPILICGAIAAVALAPLARHYLDAARAVEPRDFEANLLVSIPRPAAWAFVGERSWLYGWLARWPSFERLTLHEHALGIGPLTTLLALCGLAWRRRTGAGQIALGVLVLLVALTLRMPGEMSAWRALALLPGGQGIRAVGRVALLLLVPAGFGLSAFFSDARRLRSPVLALLAALCVLEQGQSTRTYEKADARAETTAIASMVDRGAPAFVLLTRDGRGLLPEREIDAMWAGLEVGVPTVNGYTGNAPRDWPAPSAGPEDLERVVRELARRLAESGIDPSKLSVIDEESVRAGLRR